MTSDEIQIASIEKHQELIGQEQMRGENMLDEVRRIRREYVAEFGGDLDAIYLDLKKREKASGQKCVNLRVSNQRKSKKTRRRVKSP